MDQCEYATDIIVFKSREDLEEIYQRWWNTYYNFSCEDVVVLWGEMHGSFKGEVVSTTRRSVKAVRIKKTQYEINEQKMYDKNSRY